MPTAKVNGYVTPESTAKPVVHEDLVRIVNQLMLGDVMRFASAAERDLVFTVLAMSPPIGSVCHQADTGLHFTYSGAAGGWVTVGRGFVTEAVRTSSSATFTTTETVIDSLTFTAVAGVRYKIVYESSTQSTVAGDLIQVRLRYKAGTVVDITGTEFASKQVNCDIAGRGALFSITRNIPSAIAPGSNVVAATMVRDTGTGSHSSFGSVKQEDTLRLEII